MHGRCVNLSFELPLMPVKNKNTKVTEKSKNLMPTVMRLVFIAEGDFCVLRTQKSDFLGLLVPTS